MAAIPLHRQRAYQSGDICLRAIQVIDLASQLGTDGFEGVSTFDPLGEFLGHLLEDGPKHPSVAAIAASVEADLASSDLDDEDDSIEEAGASMASGGFFGVAVEFASPVRYYRSETGWRSSWGRTYTRWIYADTLDEAWVLGVAWAEERAKADLAKFKAEGGAA